MSEQVPFKDGVLTEPLSPPEDVRLKGVKCRSCGAMALGNREFCINCTSSDLEQHIFSKYGEVYSHTIIRHSPPPPYPKDKFQPFPAAWVKLEEGLYEISTDCTMEYLSSHYVAGFDKSAPMKANAAIKMKVNDDLQVKSFSFYWG